MTKSKPIDQQKSSQELFQQLSQQQLQALLSRLNSYARLLDSKFRIPGTQIRFGWDAVIGLIPVAGDAVTVLFSSLLIFEARKARVSNAVTLKMMLNVLIELVIGAIPLFGDAFDIYWKANIRNVNLLTQYIERNSKQGTELNQSVS